MEDARAEAIYASELMQGNNPEWPFVYEKAVHEKYVELGLDKVDEARRKLQRAQDPNVCSNLSLPFPSSIANTPYVPGNSAAQLHQR